MKWISREDLEKKEEVSEEEVRKALDFAAGQVTAGLDSFTEEFPMAYSENGFYKAMDNRDWTTGFWTGEIWLAYERTRDGRLLEAGETQMESFLKRIEEQRDVETHDLGFLYSLSCVAGYKLTGSACGRRAALLAADKLIARFHEKGNFIQAWGELGAPDNYRLIIDCLLNLPLLYWASQETGRGIYGEIAQKHARTTLDHVIRPDYSTWHTFFFNQDTGEADHGATSQGCRDDSAWARGQAWGICGTAMGYRYTKNEEYISVFKGVTDYYLRHLPEDLIPFWDLEFGDGDREPRDSSSAAIAACGMLEMAKYLRREEADYYTGAAKKMLKSLIDRYAVKSREESNGLVLHSTYCKSTPCNTCVEKGVDECNIWGDYFYMEALTRLSGEWELYW